MYRLAGVPPTDLGRAMAAVLAAGDGAVASHRTAALLLGMQRLPAPDAVEVCREDTTPRSLRDVVVHRTRELPACDRTTIDGVPATTGARTLIDLAGAVERHDRMAAVDAAICGRFTSRSWLCGRATALAVGRPAASHVVSLTAPGAEGVFRSWLERRGAWVFNIGGLPQPLWNYKLYDEDGLIGLVDAWFAAQRQPVELEGLRFHTSPRARRRDAERFNRFSLADMRPPLRYTWEDIVRRPEYVVRQLHRALGLPPPDPCQIAALMGPESDKGRAG